MTKPSAIDQLITEALAIEAEAAQEAGALGFMARAMVQATMPHRKTAGNEFTRRNGAFTLNMLAPSSVGLPYGTIPRLLMAWITTEAVRTKQRELILGDSLSHFMRELDLVPTGGRWGTVTRLKNQTLRLFASTVSCSYADDERVAEVGFRIADKTVLWWDTKRPEQAALWQSIVVLTQSFFDEVLHHPIPVDMRAIKALKRSPMALDIYCWLTYRMSYLKRRTQIPWPALAAQFGSDYHRVRDFKSAFLEQMRKVSAVYGEAKFEDGDNGLILKPSRPHVAAIGRAAAPQRNKG